MSRKRKRREKRQPSRTRSDRSSEDSGAARSSSQVGLALCFAVAAFVVYAPALSGTFFADDFVNIVDNRYVSSSDSSWLPLFDPTGEPTLLTGNYAPVHLAAHRLVWTAFGRTFWGHHAVNVLVHIAVSLLLVTLLRRSGVPELGALFCGAVFLLHPANVEAVGWIYQLKTSLSQLFALAALLLFDRRLLLASAAFLLALLTKPTAAFALPVAAVLVWSRAANGGGRVPVRALGAWVIVLALFALVEFPAYSGLNVGITPAHPDLLVHARTIVALAMRYLVVATTSWGVSAWHEPAPALSWLDPWWLAGVVVLVALGARTVAALLARREEAAWWVWAVAAFVPVSQIFAFLFPMGDRYLYPILPGLLGGASLALAPLAASRLSSPLAKKALVALGLSVIVGFGVHARERAKLWGTPTLLAADAARNYPDGKNAYLLRANDAVVTGRPEEAVRQLRGAVQRGYDRVDQILAYPPYAALQGRPAFDSVVREMAGRWVERFGEYEGLNQSQLYTLGVANRLSGDLEAARRSFERAESMGGSYTEAARQELRALGGQP